MGAEEYLAVILMLPAIDSDLRAEKVENSWLLVSAALIAAMKLIRHGWEALPGMAGGFVIPVILLWPLFRIRALGAGDSKLLAVLGLMMGPRDILCCLIRTFLAGGVIAVPVLLFSGIGEERLRYLTGYVEHSLKTGVLPPYRKEGCTPGHIHMTVPVFLSVLLWAGGI